MRAIVFLVQKRKYYLFGIWISYVIGEINLYMFVYAEIVNEWCFELTHLPQVAHIHVSELGQHLFRYWLVAYSAPSRYLYQCLVIVNVTLRDNFQWNLNQNTKFFIHKNAYENIVCKMVPILSRGDGLMDSGTLSSADPTGISVDLYG